MAKENCSGPKIDAAEQLSAEQRYEMDSCGCPLPWGLSRIKELPYEYANVAGESLVLDLFQWYGEVNKPEIEQYAAGLIEEAAAQLQMEQPARGNHDCLRGAAVGMLETIAALIVFSLKNDECRRFIANIHRRSIHFLRKDASEMLDRAIAMSPPIYLSQQSN